MKELVEFHMNYGHLGIYESANMFLQLCSCMVALLLCPIVQDFRGWTALHYATLNGHASLVSSLISTYQLSPSRETKVGERAV